MTKQFTHEVKDSNIFLWYQFSKMNAIEGFDVNKYKNLKQENTIYIYDERGILLGIFNAPTMKQCIRDVKWYILKKIFLNLLKGGNDFNFDAKARRVEQKREWENLKKYLQAKFQRK